MNFGIQQPIWEDWDTTAARWQAVDQSNYRSAYVPDHPGPVQGAGSDAGTFDPWVLLAAVAPLTSRVRLGTKVCSVTFRHPTVLAKMAATVDLISGGRVVLGIGAGWLREDHGPLGFSLPPFDERMGMLEEQITVLRACWSGQPAHTPGPRYLLDSPTPVGPMPVQPGGPPVFVGGWSEGRLLDIAAAHADGFNVPHLSAEAAARKRDLLHRRCRDVGRDPGTLEITADVLLQRDRTLADAASFMHDLTVWRQGAGNVRAEADAGAVLHGDRDEILRQVEAFAAVGVDELTISAIGASLDDLLWFSDEVIPEFLG